MDDFANELSLAMDKDARLGNLNIDRGAFHIYLRATAIAFGAPRVPFIHRDDFDRIVASYPSLQKWVSQRDLLREVHQ